MANAGTLRTASSTTLIRALRRAALYSFALGVLFTSAVYCVPQLTTGSDDDTLVVGSSPDMEIISFSKKVVVRDEAKGVLVFGSDVIVEGRVTGDVASIGGSVIQRPGAFVGGDVIVVGGKYVTEAGEPLRAENKQTIIFAAYEDELREIAQNPLQIFAPSFSVAFFALRAISLLFWFLISVVFSTIAPGAVSRAVARVNLSPTKVVAIGFFSFIGANVLVFAGLSVLPNYVNAVVIGMGVLMLTLAYVFGRVVLNVTAGKMIQKHLLPNSERSESFAVLLGVVFWTVLLSLPYVWTLAILGMFAVGIGLVLTARNVAWKTR